MNRNILLGLTVLIALSMAVYFVAERPAESGDPEIGVALFPELKERLDEVTGVDIRSVEEEVRLARSEGRWVVANRNGYPLDFSKLSTLFEGIANAKFSERKTARPDNYHLLGVQGLDEEGSTATEVTIALADGSERRILIGESGSGRSGSYVRVPGEQQAWLVDRELDVQDDVAGWLAPTIIDIDSERIESVTMRAPEAEPVRAVRAEKPNGNLALLDLPDGRKLKYSTVVNTLARALANVRLKDVQPAAAFDWSGGGEAEFRCTDGLIVEVATKALDDRYYVGFSTRFERPAEPASEESEAPAEEAGEAPPAEPAPGKEAGDPQKEAAELAASLSPWVYEVTEYTFDQFTKTMADLTDAEAGEDSSEESAASS